MLDIVIRPRIIPGNIKLATHIHPLLQRIYLARGITSDEQLNHSTQALLNYQRLSDIDKATEILYQTATEQKNILIVGDFDTDGATSTALIMTALRQFGINNVNYIIPDRFEDGYGLSVSVVDKAIQQHVALIITVDNGISASAAVAYAKQHNIQVIITDHHLAPEILPSADALVNPKLPDSTFASPNLAGVGVTFYFMLAFRALLRQKQWFELHQLSQYNLANLLDLVALGTVADIVDLDQNNRILVQQGISRIRAGYCCPGIKALCKIAKRDIHRITSQDLSFYLGPRINAAGRMEHMSLGVELLLTQDEQQASELAEKLEKLNLERKQIENSMQQDAFAFIEKLEKTTQDIPNSFVVYHPQFHPGVIGILSSRIKERFYRPVITFADAEDGYLKGSGRSISQIHLRDILSKIDMRDPKLIACFGGHAMAAGLTLAADHLATFSQYFDEEVTKILSTVSLENVIETDGEVDNIFLNYQTAKIIKEAGPWGANFSEPLFEGVFQLHQQKLIGGKHLKVILEPINGGPLINGISFNIDVQQWPDKTIKQVKIVYHLEPDEFNGKQSVNLLIRYLKPVI